MGRISIGKSSPGTMLVNTSKYMQPLADRLKSAILYAEMSEWFKEPVLKTGDTERYRGFESHSPRHLYQGCDPSMRLWKRVALLLSLIAVATALYMTPLFGNKPAVIVSGSMEPAIKTGAFVLIHFSDFESCEVGDVITYYHPGFDELVTHRIVERGEDYYWTQGDANSARDDISVIEDNFYGKVIYTANWLAPLMGRWIANRQLDRAALMSVLIVVGLCAMIACVVISFVSTYLYSFLFVVRGKSYSEKTLESLSRVDVSMVKLCHKHTELSTWKRVKLNLTYRAWKRTLSDVEDELRKL